MNSEYEALIEEHCESCYYNKNGFCNIARADKECVYGNLKHDLQELDLLRKLQKEHAKTKRALEIIKELFGIKVLENDGKYFITFMITTRVIRYHGTEEIKNKEEYDLLKEELL